MQPGGGSCEGVRRAAYRLNGITVIGWAIVKEHPMDNFVGRRTSVGDFFDVVRSECFRCLSHVNAKVPTVDEHCDFGFHGLLRPKELPPWACIVPAYGRSG